MVQWILTYHHFIILGLLPVTPLILFLRSLYHGYKRKHNLQTYKWDRLVSSVTMAYIIAAVLIIGIVLGGRVI